MTRTVLFVGGSPDALGPLFATLQGDGYQVEHAPTAAEAWSRLDRTSVLLAHESLSGGGAAFLASVRATAPRIVRVLILAFDSRESVLEAVNRAEVFRLLAAPLDPGQVRSVVREALAVARLAEAQDAVWSAARQQQAALAQLRSDEGAVEHALSLVRPAPARPAERPDVPTLVRQRHVDWADLSGQRLSSREREIVVALGAGRRVKDIACDLIISTHTVRNHLKAIYRKLNVRSQFELIGLMARNH